MSGAIERALEKELRGDGFRCAQPILRATTTTPSAHEAHIAAIATSDDKDQQALFERLSVAYAAMAEMEEWLEGETALKVTLAAA